MVRFDLNDEEARALSTALATHLVGLRAELAGSDDRAYRSDLRQQLDRLEQIAARLEASALTGDAPYPAT